MALWHNSLASGIPSKPCYMCVIPERLRILYVRDPAYTKPRSFGKRNRIISPKKPVKKEHLKVMMRRIVAGRLLFKRQVCESA